MATSKPSKASPSKLIEQARKLFDARDLFEADRALAEAMKLAEAARDWPGLSASCDLLGRVRRAKLERAVEADRLIEPGPFDAETFKIERACYLIEPPMVGADGRAIRERAEAESIEVLVIVREPTTQLGQWPVVMIGPATVRVRIPPPPNDEPTIDWMLGAADALGDEAVAHGMSDERPAVRLDLLLERLATLGQHDGLTQAICETCRAMEE